MHLPRARQARRFAIALLCACLSALPARAADDPESTGLSVERLGRLDALIRTLVEQKKLSGAVVLVAKGGRIVHLEAAGSRDIGSGAPMRADSLFRLYSMTKPITSTALLMLYEEGRFQLDDPLERHIPAFADVMVFDGVDDSGRMQLVKPARKITIRDVFTHTGGISYGRDDHPVDAAYRAAGIAYGSLRLKDLVAKLATMPLRHQPGTRWQYGFSHDVQAYLVEYFSGMPFERYLDERIFKPLRMADTTFNFPAGKLDRRVAMISPPGGYKGKPSAALEFTAGLERAEPDAEYPETGGIPAGGTGLVSTAEDYFRFAQMLVNGGELDGTRLLGRKTVELMTSPHVPAGFAGIPDVLLRGSGYGLGVSVLVDPVTAGNPGSRGQFGWSGAATTHVIMDRDENLVAILLAQHRPALLPLIKTFQTLVYQSLD